MYNKIILYVKLPPLLSNAKIPLTGNFYISCKVYLECYIFNTGLPQKVKNCYFMYYVITYLSHIGSWAEAGNPFSLIIPQKKKKVLQLAERGPSCPLWEFDP